MDLETTISGLLHKCLFCEKQILLVGPASDRKAFELINGTLVRHTIESCAGSTKNYLPPQIRTCKRCGRIIAISGFRRLDSSLGWKLFEIVDGAPSTIPHKCLCDSIDVVTGKQEKYHA